MKKLEEIQTLLNVLDRRFFWRVAYPDELQYKPLAQDKEAVYKSIHYTEIGDILEQVIQTTDKALAQAKEILKEYREARLKEAENALSRSNQLMQNM